ncbi:hypothetical protein [Gemmatimonas sp.]|uniref:hypothetical protein n=1 Tax=Gemmatimonas sp. TaxID=1962908 RepID=UPI0037C0F835
MTASGNFVRARWATRAPSAVGFGVVGVGLAFGATRIPLGSGNRALAGVAA